jgi:hypothetical protein
MEKIYNALGQHVAWLNDYLLFDNDHASVGHIQSGRLFASNGDHLGKFFDNYFWELDGSAVAYVAGAFNGPPLLIEYPAVIDRLTHSGLPHLPKLPAFPFARLNQWSENDWSQFIGKPNA